MAAREMREVRLEEEGDRTAPVGCTNLKHRKVVGLPTFRKVYRMCVKLFRRKQGLSFELQPGNPIYLAEVKNQSNYNPLEAHQ
jgi:hypothetical protein